MNDIVVELLVSPGGGSGTYNYPAGTLLSTVVVEKGLTNHKIIMNDTTIPAAEYTTTALSGDMVEIWAMGASKGAI